MAVNPAILSVSQILQAAKLAGGYACIDAANKSIFKGGAIEPSRPLKIYFVYKRVQNRYDKNPSDSSLRATANLLWQLIAEYGIEALNNLDAGGVVVTSTNDVGNYLVVLKNYPQFVVADSGTPITTDGNTLTISDVDIVPESLLGSVEVHSDGSELGQALADRQNFTVNYSAGQFILTWLMPIPKGTLMQIKYPVRSTLVYSATVPINIDVIYTATLNGAETKTLEDTNGNIYTIASGTQGMLTIQLAGQDQDNNGFAGYWQYYVNNIGGTIALALSNGGIYQPYSDGDIDANTVISKDDGLQGVKIEITGFDTKIITANAKFNYSPFTF